MERQLSEFTALELAERRNQINVHLQELEIQYSIMEVERQKVDLEEYKRALAVPEVSEETK